MASAAAPYGLRAVRNWATGDTNFNVKTFSYTADIARALAVGDFINIGAGALGIPSATPTTTRNSSSPWGVVTAIRALFTNSSLRDIRYIPSNAITAGYSNIEIDYVDSPFMVYQVQASANTGASTAIGKNAALVMTAATATGSKVALDASTIATANTLAVKIIGFSGATSGDTYPEYEVIWNQNVHAFMNILGV